MDDRAKRLEISQELSAETGGEKNSSLEKFRTWVAVAVIIIAGLDLRVYTTRFEPVVFPDALEYTALARDIRSGDYFGRDFDLNEGLLISRNRPPAYSALLAIFSFLDAKPEIIGAWLSIIVSLATILPVFWLARKIDSASSGLLAALVFSFHHYVLLFAGGVLTEALFTLMFMTVIAVSLKAFSKKSYLLMAVLGLLSAIAYMTRDAGISLVLLVGAGGIIYWLLVQRTPAGKTAGMVGLMLMVFIIACIPYWIFIRANTGQWGITPQMKSEKVADKVLTHGGTRFDRDRVPGIEIPEPRKDQTRSAIKPGLSALVVHLIKKEIHLTRSYGAEFLRILGRPMAWLFYISIIIIIYRALSARGRERSFCELYVLAGIIQLIMLYALVSPYMVDERYMYANLAPGIIIASTGAVRISRLVAAAIPGAGPGAKKALSSLVIIIILALLAVYYYPRVMQVHEFMSPGSIDLKLGAGYREAAEDIRSRDLIPRGSMITDRKSFLAYYLDCTFRIIPRTQEELDEWISGGKADFISADSFTFMHTRPALVKLAFGFSGPEGTKPIYSRAFPQFRRIITVYKAGSPLSSEKDGEGPPDNITPSDIELMIVNGYLLDAVEAARGMLERDPYSIEARTLLVKAYERYYRITGLPGFLPPLIRAAENCIILVPGDEKMKSILEWARAEADFWQKKARILTIRSKAWELMPGRF